MDFDTIMGLVILGVAALPMIVAVLTGRRTINRIASNGFGSARQIMKERDRV